MHASDVQPGMGLAGGVTCGGQCGRQRRGFCPGRLDPRPVRGEAHLRRLDARHGAQRALGAAHAARAGEALHLQCEDG